MSSRALHILTPVKDSIESTLVTIRAVQASVLVMPHRYTIFDDNSTPENASRLDAAAEKLGFEVVHLKDLTVHPSPNYLFVLRHVQAEALERGEDICIVESDVTVCPDTLQNLFDGASERPDCALAAAVTVDEQGKINYPYDYARSLGKGVVKVKKHCSFCCTLLTQKFLAKFPFAELDETKNWFDVTISHEALNRGFSNYLFTALPVVHRPHQSRPWKQLKYKNPLKYYWLKYTRGLDKI